MCIGLLLASLLENLHWTRFVARLTRPLIRLGGGGDVAAASFAFAFFSPTSANALLAEGYAAGELSRRELILANLFNSLPTFLVHLPTMFSLAFAFLGIQAFAYMGLCLSAALLRTLATIATGRLLLSPSVQGCGVCGPDKPVHKTWREVVHTTLKRFKKRFSKLLLFTVPVYCLFFLMQQAGWFQAVQAWLAQHDGWLSFLNPQSVSIIAMYLLAESGAAFSAASALTQSGALLPHEVVLALLVGNILASPMRAIRHQFPSYAGYFSPPLAAVLVAVNQLCRSASLAIIAAIYFLWSM